MSCDEHGIHNCSCMGSSGMAPIYNLQNEIAALKKERDFYKDWARKLAQAFSVTAIVRRYEHARKERGYE